MVRDHFDSPSKYDYFIEPCNIKFNEEDEVEDKVEDKAELLENIKFEIFKDLKMEQYMEEKEWKIIESKREKNIKKEEKKVVVNELANELTNELVNEVKKKNQEKKIENQEKIQKKENYNKIIDQINCIERNQNQEVNELTWKTYKFEEDKYRKIKFERIYIKLSNRNVKNYKLWEFKKFINSFKVHFKIERNIVSNIGKSILEIYISSRKLPQLKTNLLKENCCIMEGYDPSTILEEEKGNCDAQTQKRNQLRRIAHLLTIARHPNLMECILETLDESLHESAYLAADEIIKNRTKINNNNE